MNTIGMIIFVAIAAIAEAFSVYASDRFSTR